MAGFSKKTLIPKGRCDSRSFRTKKLPKGRRLTVCCLKGNWNAKRGRCRIGMKGQRVLTPK